MAEVAFSRTLRQCGVRVQAGDLCILGSQRRFKSFNGGVLCTDLVLEKSPQPDPVSYHQRADNHVQHDAADLKDGHDAWILAGDWYRDSIRRSRGSISLVRFFDIAPIENRHSHV